MENQETRLCAPCHFGLEAVLKRELQDLGMEGIRGADGRVFFYGGAAEAARANVCLRTAERVMLECGSFRAETFDMLFEGVRAIPWEAYIPRDGKFWVRKASSVRSRLFSPKDIQSIVKKAVVTRLSGKYGISWFPETGAAYPLRVSIRDDVVSVCLDTTGDSLHKRGYRKEPVIAPLSETLAASLVLLTPWKRGRILADPFCGSGTIPIEAAMIARNIAPGLRRGFLMEEWENLSGAALVGKEKEEARERVLPAAESDLQGFDIDPRAARAARINADEAGVGADIHFQERPLSAFSHAGKYGFMITNPPYGERISDEAANRELYRELGEVFRRLDAWSLYCITSYRNAEREIGLPAPKNRKIYNGMIEARYLMYPGQKPPARKAVRDGQDHSGNRE